MYMGPKKYQSEAFLDAWCCWSISGKYILILFDVMSTKIDEYDILQFLPMYLECNTYVLEAY